MSLKKQFVFFSLTLIAILLYLPSFFKIQVLQKHNDDYKTQIENLTRKNINLIEEKRMLEEDPEYLEKVGRDRMRLMREGEVMYRIKEEVE